MACNCPDCTPTLCLLSGAVSNDAWLDNQSLLSTLTFREAKSGKCLEGDNLPCYGEVYMNISVHGSNYSPGQQFTIQGYVGGTATNSVTGEDELKTLTVGPLILSGCGQQSDIGFTVSPPAVLSGNAEHYASFCFECGGCEPPQ